MPIGSAWTRAQILCRTAAVAASYPMKPAACGINCGLEPLQKRVRPGELVVCRMAARCWRRCRTRRFTSIAPRTRDRSLNEILAVAQAAARDAAAVHRRFLGHVDVAEWSEKGAADFVSHVDRAAE